MFNLGPEYANFFCSDFDERIFESIFIKETNTLVVILCKIKNYIIIIVLGN